MSQCHDPYDDPARDSWLVRVDLRDMAGTVTATAVLAADGVHADGVGRAEFGRADAEQARALAAGKALLAVAESLFARVPAASSNQPSAA